MSLKKIILIGSVATVGLSIVGATTIVHKLRKKHDTDGETVSFEEILRQNLNDKLDGYLDAVNSIIEEDSDDSEHAEVEAEVDSDKDEATDEPSDVLTLTPLEGAIYGAAYKPVGSIIRINNVIYVYVGIDENDYYVLKKSQY